MSKKFTRFFSLCLVLLLGCLTLTACGGSGKLPGIWEFSTTDSGVVTALVFEFHEDMTGSLYYEFSAEDPTDADAVQQAIYLQAQLSQEAETFTYTFDEQTLTLTFGEDGSDLYTYKLDGDRLTLSQDGVDGQLVLKRRN